jgi:hypothetical protein
MDQKNNEWKIALEEEEELFKQDLRPIFLVNSFADTYFICQSNSNTMKEVEVLFIGFRGAGAIVLEALFGKKKKLIGSVILPEISMV